MRSTPLTLMLALAAGVGALAPVFSVQAQDSISTGNGLPGDAADAFQVGADQRQVLRYIVDLAPKSSSWGGQYALGPVVKASRSPSAAYFDQLIGAQAASARFGFGALFSTSPYLLWTAAPGTGVNPPSNTLASQSISGAGLLGQHFGLAFMEFGAGPDAAFGTADDDNNLIGAVIDFQFRRPNRLFVQRTVAAVNKAAAANPSTASFGLGAIDELGNLHAYADGYSTTDASRLQTRALLRFKLLSRSPTVVSSIRGFQASVIPGDSPAVDGVRLNSTMMTVPGIISAGLPSGAARPVMLSTDLLNNYVFESAANSTSTSTGYLTAAASSPRGSISFTPQVFAPVAATTNPVGTAATLARTDPVGVITTKTRAIQVFGVSSSGAPGPNLTLTLPATAAALVDSDDAFTPGSAFSPITNHEFTNYASQASFRGGNSQVALITLPGGDLLVAASVAANGGGSAVPQSQDGYIAVARVPSTGGSPIWTIAAHTGASGFAGVGAGIASKTIYSRTSPTIGPLTPIGRLARYSEVFGSSATGPSLSAPAFDSAGNIYFMATIGLTGATTNFTTGLLRANFNPATNAYQLELLASVGDILPGLNSGRNYQIQFLGVADADSIDSGSIFSSSTVRDSIAGVSAAPYGSPLSLGALVFRAKIVYDVNADTMFADPSGPGSGASPDQAYNVAMVLMPRIPRADFNRDQIVNVADIFAFLSAWFASAPGADWNGNGAITVGDIFDFLSDWFSGG